VAEKPDLATRVGASSTLTASAPHRLFDQAAGAMVDCEKVSRDALEQGRAYPGPLLVIDEGSSLAIHGNQTSSPVSRRPIRTASATPSAARPRSSR